MGASRSTWKVSFLYSQPASQPARPHIIILSCVYFIWKVFKARKERGNWYVGVFFFFPSFYECLGCDFGHSTVFVVARQMNYHGGGDDDDVDHRCHPSCFSKARYVTIVRNRQMRGSRGRWSWEEDAIPFNDTRFPGESFISIRSELTLHLFRCQPRGTERETEPAQRMGSMAGQRDFQSPRQHPIQRGFSSWHLTDDNDDDVKGVEGDKGLKDTPSRCASSSASLQVSSGELEATELSVSMYGIESAKNQFQSFWGNFFIAIFGVLPDPPWVFEPGEGIAQVMWTNKAIEWF